MERITSSGRFMIAEPHYYDDDGTYAVRGGGHPHTYKTFRNAARELRGGSGAGLILLWDPSLLPVVAADDPIIDEPNLADRMSEIEFCDRQIQLWADRAARARAGERLSLELIFDAERKESLSP